MSFFKSDRHSSTETNEKCPKCGTFGISGQPCPNPLCDHKFSPNVAQVFVDPFLDVGRAAAESKDKMSQSAADLGRTIDQTSSETADGAAKAVRQGGCLGGVAYLVGLAALPLLLISLFYLKEIFAIAVAGVVLLIAVLVARTLGRKFGLVKVSLLLGGLVAASFVLVLTRALREVENHSRREAIRQQEDDQERTRSESEKTRVLAEKRTAFQTGYSTVVGQAAEVLPATLTGSWKVRDMGRSSPTSATVTATMISGLEPNLTEVRFRTTDEHVAFVGAGQRYGSPLRCAGAFEPVGIGDRVLLGMGCQSIGDGSLLAAVYVSSNANLTKELQKGARADETALLPRELRGVWLADDEDCSRRKADSKRRVIITSSIILGNGGNDRDGIIQVRVASSTGTVAFEGLGGPSWGNRSCRGQIESSGGAAYVMSVTCDGQHNSAPTQLCRKTTAWQDW
jgi:energy-coupling factor transporter transmembrane protein EcfT